MRGVTVAKSSSAARVAKHRAKRRAEKLLAASAATEVKPLPLSIERSRKRPDPHAASWGAGVGAVDAAPTLRELPPLVVKQKRGRGRPRKALPLDMPISPATP